MQSISEILAQELNCKQEYIENVIALLDEGNTIPFIARYRKEQHGAMDDTALRTLETRLQYLRNLAQRREEVKSSIAAQEKLTDELAKAIDEAATLAEVEDLYRPYKPKRRTRATIAKEKGLEPLADAIFAQTLKMDAPEVLAQAYIDPEKGVETIEDALAGASDILAERISDDAEVRKSLRTLINRRGTARSAAAKDEEDDKTAVYRQYFEFSQPISRLQSHQVLALNRGEREGALKVSLSVDRDEALQCIRRGVVKPGSPAMEFIKSVCDDSYDRLLEPSMERELRTALTDMANEQAIHNFALNLRPLLMQPPVKGAVTMGLDPGYSHGCKVAVVDETGKVLDTTVVYPTFGEKQKQDAIAKLSQLIKKDNVRHLAIGNGTASRETEAMAVEMIHKLGGGVSYMIVNEAGASVYSASKLGAEEFPEYDVSLRSAVSIARRLQDPLAELVKIEPRSIGVGQYQHDMNQKKLSDALSGVVEDSVNKVGVDLNTASASLLEYVSGINKTIAKNIVDYRENNGRFVSRKQLLKVPKLGPKAYEQCAGFLRIPDGKNPLDATSVHPESYEAAEQLMAKLGLTMEDIKEAQKQAAAKKASDKSGAQASGQKNGSNAANTAKKREEQKGKTVRVHNTNTAMGKALAAAMGGVSFDNSAETSTKKNAPAVQNASNDAKDISGLEKRIKNKKLLAEELGIGEITLTDILKELEKPGRDPRDDMPKPILRSDVLDMKDLKPGMILKGTVRNVIDFGVFVDIGVHQDGLVHISQITDRYIKHPLEAVSVGDIVDVQVLTVDVAKKRIGLTMKIQKQ